MRQSKGPAPRWIWALLAIAATALLIGLYCRRDGKPLPTPPPGSEPAKAASKQASKPLTPVSFRLKWLVYSSFASHFVALERGYFEEYGVNVTINPGGPGLDPIKLVATGADDVGLAGYEQILIAREKGIPVVAIGEDYIRAGVAPLALRSSGIKEPKDFVGKKVGILPGTDKHAIYIALMAKCGVDRSKIEEIPIGSDIKLLFSGTIDVFPGFITNQPIVAEEAGYPVNVIDPQAYGVRPGGNVYFTSEATLARKRSALKGFLRAVLKGIIESQKLPNQEVVDIIMKHNDKLNKETELKIWRATKDMLLEKNPTKVGLLYEEKWKETAQMAVDSELIKTVPKLGECYTNDLVKEILDVGL
jgi:ABC-type nitrate/sulfonate/bicarbonate transport system substrate-binding protein